MSLGSILFENVTVMEFMSNLDLPACQVINIVGETGLCCCVPFCPSGVYPVLLALNSSPDNSAW